MVAFHKNILFPLAALHLRLPTADVASVLICGTVSLTHERDDVNNPSNQHGDGNASLSVCLSRLRCFFDYISALPCLQFITSTFLDVPELCHHYPGIFVRKIMRYDEFNISMDSRTGMRFNTRTLCTHSLTWCQVRRDVVVACNEDFMLY